MRFLTASPNENSLIQNPASTFRVRRIPIRRFKAVWKPLHPIISQYAVIETINSLALKSFLSLKQKMVPGTYTQIYLHFVIVVKFREALIQPKYQEEVFSFMSGLINSMGHRSYAVNGMPDHVHIFMSFTPSNLQLKL
jgi:hypothetical protein